MAKNDSWRMYPERPEFKEYVKRLRRQRGWSQEEAGRRCGIDHSLVARLEGGQRGVTPWVVDRLIAGYELGDVAADVLRHEAGYAMEDPLTALRAEPDLVILYRLLTDDKISAKVRLPIRQAVTGMAAAAVGLASGAGVRPPVGWVPLEEREPVPFR